MDYKTGRIAALALLLISSSAFSQTIDQSRGADQAVNYRALANFGPWDDRNYELTAKDVNLLSPEEDRLNDPIPAFFRVELRREFPALRRSGPAQYPRAAVPLFYKRYSGLFQDGKFIEESRKVSKTDDSGAQRAIVTSEIKLNDVLGANEVTVEINPANPMQVIAGANNQSSQEMYYSTDGGSNWTIQGLLPDTCCDPTIGWRTDGTIAYTASLSGNLGVSFWRSMDGGQTWQDRVNLTDGGSDKEFIHVDRSDTSAYQDNIYVTYHDGNVMQFARSVDDGATFDITALESAHRGIGSDITTTSNGDIYYFYAAFNSQTIELLKSTDGGDTFADSFEVAGTNGEYDFPIPAMESRWAWIYAAADADLSGRTYDGNVYVAWTDTTNSPASETAAENHTIINVASSSDGGATWVISNPHPMDDTDTVDRFNQWLSVDDAGNVHVIYYDTQHSVDRTGVDLYYNFSVDGGATWGTPQRISSETSANLSDGQEWGDYNGLSVFATRALPGWTDNRNGPPDEKNVYIADTLNELADPTFLLSGDNVSQQVCTPDNLADINLSIVSILGFSEDVTLSTSGMPAGFTSAFTINPVAAPGSSVAQLSVAEPAVAGPYTFDIVGTGGTKTSSLPIDVVVFDAIPAVPALIAPADESTISSVTPTLEWSEVIQAGAYTVEIDDDPGFGSVDFTHEVKGSSLVTDPLGGSTTWYWRVRASNSCGEAAWSGVYSFETPALTCSQPGVPIPETAGGVSDDLVIGNSLAAQDLNVFLDISHTYIGDVGVTLTHQETGTTVILLDRPGAPASTYGCPGNNILVTLDDSAPTPAEDQCEEDPALSGVHSPTGLLSTFNGEDLAGTWRLTVTDAVALDTGTLNRWCVDFGASNEAADTIFKDGFED